ncbi:MAG: carbamoyl-phosphate synthase large subunit [Candidatus Alcyoniella australis]|nr:carbamoyl-phosphate synthase large subunit [Candidatus Alcyoniella australis]
MPKRTDIKRIMIIGSGPIVIGQACEFDYSGTQACKALRAEGYEVVLLNSNPATIMTDPEIADRTYIEPITAEVVERIIARDRPDALLPTMGGQTGLNTAVEVAESGLLERYGVELIGAKLESIKMAEDRELFKQAMERIGLDLPISATITTLRQAQEFVQQIGYPAIIRPSFTLGGTGGNVAYNPQEYEEYVKWGLSMSPYGQVLIEQSLLGWKEYELEVMRDLADNVVIICSIENLDPMGVHTGDSITVAPAQTLTDKEYQLMRDASLAIIREIGVETGGSNIQFAVNPRSGRMVVIEMNPRVSRSSALASKATGFPIAKIAAKLAVGLTLPEIPNDITRTTPASFEPTIDYCVVKIPRFDFEKFPAADKTLTTQMKSVGEAMSIGRTFKEALGKAIRSLENGRFSLEQPNAFVQDGRLIDPEGLKQKLRKPCWNRLWYICEALRMGISPQQIYEISGVDPWFLHSIEPLLAMERELAAAISDGGLEALADERLREAKRLGFSDHYLAQISGKTQVEVREHRLSRGIHATFKMVDTCGAEFEAHTPYFYSCYESECEARPSKARKVMILGGGPNRIGQGIEFDYCCVHAACALKELGFETIMVNCNPETVSTDYDTSDRLYFEPLTFEDVMNIVDVEKPEGVIVQFGGQTPLKLAVPLERAGVKILGTSPDAIDRAEDRERFQHLLYELGLTQPDNGIATNEQQALDAAERIGYPVVVRPSYVLGGRAMEIVYDAESLRRYMRHAVQASPEHPVLIDKFLDNAIEIDVDAVCDGTRVTIGGIMEQIEQAGVHSGDSSCSLPAVSLAPELLDGIRSQTAALALELGVIGLLNIQMAVMDGQIYILEVNPRASRTVPFVSKSIGKPLAKIATKVMAGMTLEQIGFTQEVRTPHITVKEAVYPFIKFPGVDTILGPEMKSTGEVMGIARDFGQAFAKSQVSADNKLPRSGKVFISVRDRDKPAMVDVARRLIALGFEILSTRGTAAALDAAGVMVMPVFKVQEGRPHIADMMVNGEVQLVINTVTGSRPLADSYTIRRTALEHRIPYFTTAPEARAALAAIESNAAGEWEIRSLQEYYEAL